MLGTRRKKNVLAGTFVVSLKTKREVDVGSIRILGKCQLNVKYCILETMWKVKKCH